jgi:hypothetical protein
MPEYVPFTIKEANKYANKPCTTCGSIDGIKKYKLPSQDKHYAKIGCVDCETFLQFGSKPENLKAEDTMKLSSTQIDYLKWVMKKTGHDENIYNFDEMTLKSGTAILRLLKSWLNNGKEYGMKEMSSDEALHELEGMEYNEQ